jgi:heterodisulfide reductase subunit D
MMPVCPAGITYKFDSYYGTGRVTVARKYMEGVIDYNESLAKLVYSCTLCGACHVQCPINGFDPTEVTRYLREEAAAKGFASKYYSVPEEKPISYEIRADSDIGLLAGCTNNGDETLVKNVAKLLKAAGVKFKTVSPAVGAYSVRKGDKEDFDRIKAGTTESLKSAGIKELIVYSPLDYKTLLLDYEQDSIKISFYTDYLVNLTFKALPSVKKVAYHDPAHLGRFTNYRDVPRQLLKKIENLKLTEFKRAGANTLCSSSLPDCDEKIVATVSSLRLAEAADIGAEMIITSCFNCKRTLEKQAKLENLPISVKETAEFLTELLPE